jgi:hypothetical protein
MTRTIKKFNQWDQTVIFNSLEKITQIRYAIEESCNKNNVNPKDMPLSVLPTDILYDICSCYEAMHYKLLKYDLLNAGHPKPNLTTKH